MIKQLLTKLWLVLAIVMASVGSAWGQKNTEPLLPDDENPFLDKSNYEISSPTPGVLHMKFIVSYIDDEGRYYFHVTGTEYNGNGSGLIPYVYIEDQEGKSVATLSPLGNIAMFNDGGVISIPFSNGWENSFPVRIIRDNFHYWTSNVDFYIKNNIFHTDHHDLKMADFPRFNSTWISANKAITTSEDGKISYIECDVIFDKKYQGCKISSVQFQMQDLYRTRNKVKFNEENDVEALLGYYVWTGNGYGYKMHYPSPVVFNLGVQIPENCEERKTPELFSANIAMDDGTGVVKKPGQMMVIYNSQHKVDKVRCSATKNEWKTPEADNFFLIDAADTVRTMNADFQQRYRKECPHETYTARAKAAVKVPAYHKIYNFNTTRYKDGDGIRKGGTKLTWEIKSPEEEDAVSGDIFEIQRATKFDWSDAETIDIIPMDEEMSQYTYIDSTATTLKWQSSGDGHILYYRVRRASTSMWDWTDFGIDGKQNLQRLLEGHAVCDYATAYHVTQRKFENAKAVKADDWATSRKVKITATLPKSEVTWHDRTAPVSLIRYSSETIDGDKTIDEIPVPEDSIRYDSKDGSFYLSFTDVTNTACTHYSYVLKKDLTKATLGICPQSPLTSKGSDKTSPKGEGVENLFDNNKETKWCVTNVGTSTVLLELFTSSPTAIKSYSFVTGNDVIDGSSIRNPSGWKVTVKNEKNNWVTLGEVDNSGNQALPTTKHTESQVFTLPTNVQSKSFRFLFYSPVVGTVMELADMDIKFTTETDTTQLLANVSASDDFYFDGGMKMANVTATKDNPKMTVLTWETTGGAFERYEVYRKNSVTNAWDRISETYEMVYEDDDAPVGKDCEYKVKGILDCKEQVVDESSVVIGHRYEYGSVSGHVTYLDGVGCPGMKVSITKKGDKTPTVTTTTADDGSFLLDHVFFTSEGIEYLVDVEGLMTKTVSLTGSQPIVTAINFQNDKAVRFSGFVYYKGSTVPVHHANFEVNGRKLLTAGGDPVETNASGAFNFLVPKEQQMTIRVVMDGHTFMDGGDVMDDKGNTQFSLTKALDQYVFYDETKVRLIGRLVGGTIEGQKPLGLDLSTNNLGDNPQFVLELEGDNISHLVFEPNDLSIKERNDTIQHNGHRTAVHTQAKRITIEVDPVSGEYQADLFPVKYKVVQATAQGYSSLLSAGSAMPSLNLSDCVEMKRDTVKQDFDLGILNDTYVDYNAKYSVIYRSPISLTYKQLVFGLEKNYLGEAQFMNKPMVDDEGKYTFGYPVFNQDNSYIMRVSAHEDYYYNNDVKNVDRHTTVPIKNHDMRIYNGMNTSLEPEFAHLDQNGQAIIKLSVNNPTLELKGESALRTVDMSVNIDGLYVQCEQLKGYVLGHRLKGRDYVQKFNTVPVPIDVIRDPQGANSYAWIEKGSTLNLDYHSSWSLRAGVALNFTFGSNEWASMGVITAPMGVGAHTTMTIQSESTLGSSMDIATSWHGSSFNKYSFNTKERIATSSASTNIGAPADVYLGTEVVTVLAETDAATVLDGKAYRMFKNAIDEGKIRILSRYESEKDSLYLVNMTQMAYGTDIEGSFAYTQKHIVNEILPHLLTERNALLLTKQADVDYQEMADKQKKNIYVSTVDKDSENFGIDYKVYTPNGKDFQAYSDEVGGYNMQMSAWIDMIAANEQKKLEAPTRGSLLGSYNLSGGVTREYSETAAASSSSTWMYDGPLGLGGGIVAGLGNFFWKIWKSQKDSQGNKKHADFSFKCFGVKVTLGFAPIIEYTPSKSEVAEEGNSKTAGFVLAPSAESYETIDVYRVTNDMFASHDTTIDDINDKREETEDDVDFEAGGDRQYADFVFIRSAGATRNPYEDAEICIANDGAIISPATLKVDNPTITFDRHEVSNVPADEKAHFTVRLSNESEVNDGRSFLTTPFILSQDVYSNPNGLTILMDGQPITDGRIFYMKPGESIVKDIEVVRGTAYDYDDVKLRFESANDVNLFSLASFSAHYMPVSCPVTMQLPVQNWVMNTLSPQDRDGYYIPVEINGFDVNYENFDHIELQYKLKSEADDRWVNLCSYYANDSLYNLASGNKEMIKNGRITNARFYGERDPMEQYYDLRAVSFCRLGTGFVSRSSDVKNGLKDTRRPELFGAITPKNGILQVGDYISIPFSEDIAANYLDALYNFQITGYTNETNVLSSTSLQFDGNTNEKAETAVNRNLSDVSFTIDMMVKPDKLDKQMVYFTHGTADKYVSFGQTADQRLFITMKTVANSDTVFSQKTNLINDWNRVAVSYDRENMQDNVTFWLGTDVVPNMPGKSGKKAILPWNYNGNGKLSLGRGINGEDPYKGGMLEVRLWTKVMDRTDIVATNCKVLSGYEPNLRAYYQMNDATNLSSVKDKANGATLILDGQTWNKPEGLSVVVSPGSSAIALDGHKFSATTTADYTLTFWFKQKTLATDTVALMASGRGIKNEPGAESKIFFGLTKEGHIVLQHNGEQTIAEGNFNDLNWHQVALTVGRSTNIATLYVDNNTMAQVSASSFGALDADSLWLGTCHWKTLNPDGSTTKQPKHYDFDGYFDDVTMWNAALHKTYLESFYSQAPNGEENSLMNFLSFCKRQLDAHNVYQSVYDPLNQKVNRDEEGKIVERKESDRLVLTADNDVQTSTEVAPIREKENLTNLNFSWVGKENELLINLKMPDIEINKQNVFITVRDVEDKAGNPMESPLTWTIFVDRNQLRWGSEYIDLKLEHGESKQFMVEARNNASSVMNYTITDIPRWLKVSAIEGSLNPTQVVPLYFEISDELDPGEHTATIYLKDQNGLSEPLDINVWVNAVKPTWEIDPLKYNRSMNLIARVDVLDYVDNSGIPVRYIDSNPNDIVAAFIDEECVGLANISINTDPSGLYMTIYGMSDQYDMAGNKIANSTEGKNVVFLLWREETGKIYYLHIDDENLKEITFKSDTIYGQPEHPVKLYTSDNSVQNIQLRRGWNWISFYVRPYTLGKNFSDAFVKDYEFANYDYIKSNGFSAEYIDGTWVSDAAQFVHTQSYMFKVSNPGILGVNGSVLKTDAECKLRIKNGWNYLPYLCNHTMTITDAMADYFDNAKPGDIIKTYNSFAMFSENKQWIGSLEHMQPGVGYMLMRNGESTVDFTYYEFRNEPGQINPGDKSKAKTMVRPVETEEDCVLTRSHNMPIVANALRADGNMAEAGDVLCAYDGDELVGRAIANADGRFFLMTSAEEGANMHFTLKNGDNEETSAPMLTYNSQGSAGTLDSPFCINFMKDAISVYPTVVQDHVTFAVKGNDGQSIKLMIVDAAGRTHFEKSVSVNGGYATYTLSGMDKYAEGVYVAVVIVDGKKTNVKLIKK